LVHGSQIEFCDIEEASQEFFVGINVFNGVESGFHELPGIRRSEFGEFHVFEMISAGLDRIEFRRIGRQAFDVKPFRMLTQKFVFESDVSGKAVPNENDRATEVSVKFQQNQVRSGVDALPGNIVNRKFGSWRIGETERKPTEVMALRFSLSTMTLG
jgi:hypothetical protein